MESAKPASIDILVIATAINSIGVIAVIATAIFTYMTVRQAARAQQAQVFIEIAKGFSEIYFKRNQLLKTSLDWHTLSSKYPKVEDIVNGDEWKTLRPVAGYYEMIGILVKHKYIDPE